MRHEEMVAMIDRTVRDRGLNSGLRLLDVVCGRGQLLGRLARPGWRLTGCDSLDLPGAEQDFHYRRVNLDREGLAAFGNASFDIVTCSDVLEHMENPAALLREIARVLTCSGAAIVSIPNSWNILERLRYLRGANLRRLRAGRYATPSGHIAFMTPHILLSLCDRARLHIVAIIWGPAKGHLAFGGYFMRVPPSTLLTYTLYIVLTHSEIARKQPMEQATS
jgi:2-polyprenyl-6-hydroxyphenyl methylase/3-demethylubiquinone-9 3-methyltransferase